jgi:serine/threonine-protein phosphatase 2B regulatory subunit
MNAQVRQIVLDRIAAIMDGYYQSSSHEEEFQASQSQATQSAQILVKCYFPDDIRLLEVAKNISYEDLIALIAAKYGRTLNVSYIDADGDPVRLDHGSMSIAFGSSENAMNTSAATVKLMLTDKTNALASSAAAAAAYQAVPRSPDEDEDAGIPSKKRSRTGSQIVHSASSSSAPVAFGGSVVFAKALGLDLEGGADLMKDEFAAMKLVQRNQNFSHIRSSTKFGDKELESLYVQWTQNSPSGQVGRQQFEEGMKSIGVTDPLVIEQNFNAFDVDKDGQIDFREFVVSLSTILTGSDEDRMKFMFRSYDADNSGNLSTEEVFNIFRASMAINGTVASNEELMKTVTSVFAEIDLDGNGEISFDEFRLAVESGKLPVSLAFSVMQ